MFTCGVEPFRCPSLRQPLMLVVFLIYVALYIWCGAWPLRCLGIPLSLVLVILFKLYKIVI
jgi:hypothetical protein